MEREQIKKSFFKDEGESELIDALVELASTYQLSGAELAVKYNLFAVKNLCELIFDGGPTLSNIEPFREYLEILAKTSVKPNSVQNTPVKQRNGIKIEEDESFNMKIMYNSLQDTPQKPKFKDEVEEVPLTTSRNYLSEKFNEKSGNVLFKLKDQFTLSNLESSINGVEFTVKNLDYTNLEPRYMKYNQTEAWYKLDNQVRKLGPSLIKELKANQPIVEQNAMEEEREEEKSKEVVNAEEEDDILLQSVVDPTVPSQSEILVLGRIQVANGESKLAYDSVYFQPFLYERLPEQHQILLDLSTLTTPTSLFSGQIVAMLGSNPEGNCFKVTQLVYGDFHFAEDEPVDVDLNLTTNLLVYVAKGPYTFDADIKFEAFDLLLTHIDQSLVQHPDANHLLILAGPFIDEKNKFINRQAAPPPEELFKNQMGAKLNTLVHKFSHSLKVCLQPALDDLLSQHLILPQPRFDNLKLELGVNHPNVVSLNNPSHILLDDKLKLTSLNADLPIALSSTELFLDVPQLNVKPKPRITRLLDHVLKQRSTFPIYPPPPASEILVDLEKLDKLDLPHVPNFLIVPSKLNHFVQVLGDNTCIAINPGKLTKIDQLGTYAKISIQSGSYWGEAYSRGFAESVVEDTQVEIISL